MIEFKLVSSALLLASLGGACAYSASATVDVSAQAPFGVIGMGSYDSYSIDPRTETCIWTRYGAGSVIVDCAKLKKNLPEAAALISWLP